MAVVFPGDAVVELIKNATSRIVIIAPYIKSATIRRLLKTIPDSVSECTCITRWLPEDIVSGVCDLEVLDEITQIPCGRLLVHPHLHAKYYSNGHNTLIGSANLTSRGLGWHTPSNVELLVALPSDFPGLTHWESALLDSAVEATEKLREQISVQVAQLAQSRPMYSPPEVEDVTGEEEKTGLWVPRCPVPERLWEVYCGHGADTMVRSAYEAAHDDLAALSPPQGLNEDLFTAFVTGILRQMPFYLEIDLMSSTGLTDMKAQEFLANSLGEGKTSNDDYGQIWRIVKLWLVHFFPELYRVETSQEILVKGRKIQRR